MQSHFQAVPAASSLPAWLCAACKLIGEGEDTLLHPRQHHRSFETFHEAKRLGCSICLRLWARLHSKRDFNPSRNGEIQITYHFREILGGNYMILRFEILIPGQSPTLYLEFSLMKDNTGMYDRTCEPRLVNILPAETDGPFLQRFDHEITASTDSESIASLVQHWLSDCQANHPGCNRNADVQRVLPLRVIDVGKIGEPFVCLSVSELSLGYGSYMTLSHCWGDSDIMKLTVENETTLREGFAIKNLPKTFREAIQFTRALLVKYLWIDSLCILQDSLEDWRHQSALMGEIYRNCFCNLAATSSSNSQGGIFVERDPDLIRPLSLEIMSKNGHDGLERQERYYLWDSSLWRDHVELAPLNRRGWVLQERLLAPRVVHFSKYIFWECKSLVSCEIMPTGEPFDFQLDYNSFYTRFLQIIEKVSAQEHETTDEKTKLTQAAHHLWWDLVLTYSRCALSKDEDILVAISGIANIMENNLKDQYIGGLWRSTLLKDLLWSSRTPSSVRPFPLLAPTWSWASMKGPIFRSTVSEGFCRRVLDFAQIMDIQIKTSGDERNGQIENGYLTIQGLLFDLLWNEEMYQLNVSRCNFKVNVELDDHIAGKSHRQKQGTKFLCIPICMSENPCIILDGLVLELAPHGYPEGHFMRIGTFRAKSDPEEIRPHIEEILLELEKQEKRIIVLA
ncbi:HET-domain-containing protein [Stipitochalara longipes BDJ]|nr:HET-domain-containing protein [Stipitochalara longipes BDJ]